MNDMNYACPSLETIHHADDTTLLISGNCVDTLCFRLNQELESLFNWLNCNILTLHVTKSMFMIYGNCQPDTIVNVNVRDVSLMHTNEAKCLDVIIDGRLTPDSHALNTIRIIIQAPGVKNTDNVVLFLGLVSHDICHIGEG